MPAAAGDSWRTAIALRPHAWFVVKNRGCPAGTILASAHGMTRRRIVEPGMIWALSRRTTRPDNVAKSTGRTASSTLIRLRREQQPLEIPSRGDWIRTSDLMLPKHAHYQAVLHPVTRFSYCGLAAMGSRSLRGPQLQ